MHADARCPETRYRPPSGAPASHDEASWIWTRLIITGQAAHRAVLGAIRYITHAHLWGGGAYAILGR